MVYKILTIGAAAMLALTGCANDDPDRDDDRINIEAPAKERETRENQANDGGNEAKPSGKSLKHKDWDDDWYDDDWDDDYEGPLKPGAWEILLEHSTLVDEYNPQGEDLDD